MRDDENNMKDEVSSTLEKNDHSATFLFILHPSAFIHFPVR